jgi:hypothetical protein
MIACFIRRSFTAGYARQTIILEQAHWIAHP